MRDRTRRESRRPPIEALHGLRSGRRGLVGIVEEVAAGIGKLREAFEGMEETRGDS